MLVILSYFQNTKIAFTHLFNACIASGSSLRQTRFSFHFTKTAWIFFEPLRDFC